VSRENRDFVLSVFAENGRRDALDLRSRAKNMDGTAIIAEETKIPAWNGGKDYSAWEAGAPVCYNGNVFGLLLMGSAVATWRFFDTLNKVEAELNRREMNN